MIVLFLAVSLYPADFRYLNISAIMNIEEYENEFLFVANNQEYLKYYTSDDLWKTELSKAEYIEKLEELYFRIEEFPEPENQEYLLLKAMVSEYLYNLDAPEYFQKTVDNYMAVESLEARDYRYKWMLGLFYASAAKPFDSIKQFDFVLSKIPKEYLHPDFFCDYAYALCLANMPENALLNYEFYFELTGTDPASNGLYNSIKKDLLDGPELLEPEFDDFFRYSLREDSEGFFSRFYGCYLAVSRDWRMEPFVSDNRTAVVSFTPPKVWHISGAEISYTILCMSELDNPSSWESIKAKMPNPQRVDLGLPGNYEVYEISDENIYQHMGGGRGYYAFIEREYSADGALELEAPVRYEFGDSSSQVKYLILPDEYLRYPGKIYHLVLLDTCGFIFSESKEVYIKFLSDSMFK